MEGVHSLRRPTSGGLGEAIQWIERLPVPRVFGLGRDTSAFVCAWFIWGIGAGLWSYFWPVYLNRLGADSVKVGLVVGSASVVTTLVYLPGGIVAQLGRHKWQLVLAHLLAAIGTASFGLAQTWWQVLPGVACTGLVALFSPAINSLIAQTADDDRVSVPTIYTALGVAQFSTMTISPPIGGWIADRYGMAALFPLVGLVYCAAVATMCLIRSRPMPSDTGTPENERTVVRDPAAARRSALAAGSGAYRSVLAHPTVRLLLLLAFLLHAGVQIALSFGPLYLRQRYGYDAAAIGWTGSAASAGAVALLLGIERLRRRWDAVRATWISCGLITLHYGCVVVSPLPAVQLAGFFCRGGVQTMATVVTVALTSLVPRTTLAPAIALYATVAGLAAIAAPPLGGWLYELAPAAPFAAGAGLLLLAAPLVPRAVRQSKR